MITTKSVIISFLLLGSMILVSPANGTQISIDKVGLDQTVIGPILSLNVTGNDTVTKAVGQRYDLVQLGDGKISEVWADVPEYPLASFGEKGMISSLYGVDTVYFLLKQNPAEGFGWVSLQWDSDGSSDPEVELDISQMAEGDDIWVFGEAEETSIIGDAHGISDAPLIAADESDELFWERVLVNDTEGNVDYIAWEIRRAKTTTDPTGSDVQFSTNTNVTVRFASEEHHKGDGGNDIAKFVLSSTTLGSDTPIITEPIQTTEDDGESLNFIRKHVLIGLAIGIASYIIIFVPTITILRKQQEGAQ